MIPEMKKASMYLSFSQQKIEKIEASASTS